MEQRQEGFGPEWRALRIGELVDLEGGVGRHALDAAFRQKHPMARAVQARPAPSPEDARIETVEIRRLDDEHAPWRQERCAVAQKFYGVSDVLDHIEREDDVEGPDVTVLLEWPQEKVVSFGFGAVLRTGI